MLDLVEAGVLSSHVGETFTAVVVDVDEKKPTHGRITIADPAVEADATSAGTLPLGQEIQVKLAEADPAQRRVTFSA